MDKYRPSWPDEAPPALDGPDYVALVIEWDDIADSLDNVTERGMTSAARRDMSNLNQDPDWSRVDEASMESFPASDPPAWGSSHAVAQAGVPEDLAEEVTAPFRPSAESHGVRRFVLGLAALAALLSMIEGLRRIRRHA